MEQIGLLLLIVAFSVVRALVRRARKKATPVQKKRSSTLAGWLKRLKREMEAARPREEGLDPDATTGDLWGELFGGRQEPGAESRPAWGLPDEAPRETVDFARASAPEVEGHGTVESEPAPLAAKAPRGVATPPGSGPARLRQAVVWSEILAPPVALRE